MPQSQGNYYQLPAALGSWDWTDARYALVRKALESCGPSGEEQRVKALSAAFEGINGCRLTRLRGPDSVYGELENIEEYVRVLKYSRRLGPQASFVDLGAGLGKPATVAASIFGCKRALGIETARRLHAVSESIRCVLERAGVLSPHTLAFTLGDLHHRWRLWTSAEVVYVCCLTWSRRSIERLFAGLSKLKRGSEVFISLPLRNCAFRLRTVIDASGTWGGTRLYLYDKVA